MYKIILISFFTFFFYSCSVIIPLNDLPKPMGNFIVGTDLFNWEDTSRDEWFTKDKIDSRKIVVQIWYPAQASSDSLYPYMDNAEIRLEALSKQLGVPQFAMKHAKDIKGNSYFKAEPIRDKKFPIIIFSHGLGGTKTQNSINIEELVSNGYIVVAPDHTYDASMTIFDDGSTYEFKSGLPVSQLKNNLVTEKVFWETRLPQIKTRAGDIKFIIDKLQTMKENKLYSSIDFNKIGVFGHSFGGATSVVSSWNDSRISACLNLDGWFEPIINDIINNGLKIPFCYIGQENWGENSKNYQKVYDFFENCQSDTYFIKIKETKHFDYADLPYITKVGKIFKLSGKNVDKDFTIEINKVILGFFNEYLKNDFSNWAEDLTKNYDTIVKFK